LFGHLLRLKGAAREAIIAEALRCARRRSPDDPVAGWILALGTAYPGDIGVVAPTILNLVRLEPGQAMYLPARQLHAYLKGVGIELMANSDNVLRGGLTPKHVDGDELMRVLHFVPGPPGIVVPQPIAPTEEVFPTPATEFQLSRIQLNPPAIHEASADHSVEILLATSGALTLEAPHRKPLRLFRGESVLIPATSGRYTLSGRGVCYKAAVPLTKD
jgi:mannose-6-phosphate isomerase